MTGYREISFTDELLADGGVHRRYSDGRQEWRWRDQRQPVVHWRDNQANSGTDEQLGQRIIKRRFATGQVLYGRDLGYGRTVWSDGILTRNRTSFGGRMGAILAAAGAGALLGAVVAPPLAMSADEEEQLRQQQAGGGGGSGGDAGSSGGTTGDDDWDDDTSDGDDGDFG